MSIREEIIDMLSKKWNREDAIQFTASIDEYKVLAKEKARIVKEMTASCQPYFEEETDKIVELIIRVIDENASKDNQ